MGVRWGTYNANFVGMAVKIHLVQLVWHLPVEQKVLGSIPGRIIDKSPFSFWSPTGYCTLAVAVR